jgi:hypothetical protein
MNEDSKYVLFLGTNFFQLIKFVLEIGLPTVQKAASSSKIQKQTKV